MPRTLLLAICLLATAPADAQTQAEVEFAMKLLASVQADSFDRNREYCGTIGVDETGRLIASQPRRGRRDSCQPRDPRGVTEVIASFHSHAAFDADADSEVPSVDDVLGDMEEGIDGYVATPGGRFWFIDGQTGSVRQICGLGCLPADPDFVPQVFGPVRQRYSLGELERRETE
ncbi:MAG: DUF4329 domain-containing protein [Rhodobacter sp.]|nr:DUF4329 domain-containing protein [Rhodobacter sp.]